MTIIGVLVREANLKEVVSETEITTMNLNKMQPRCLHN